MQLPELFGDGMGVFAVHDEARDGNGRDVDAFFLERLEDALRQRANTCLTDTQREKIRMRLKAEAAAREQDGA